MMNQRALLQIGRRVYGAARFMSADAAAAPASSVKLNFSLPHEKLYDEVFVHSVIIPGSDGEYGVTANHVPYVAQLKPGVLQIYREEGATEPEKYFVAGGYALTHKDSSTVRSTTTPWQGNDFNVRMLTIFFLLIRMWFVPRRSS
jgi:F-type H+-transporting ATPase subunit delta